MGDILKSYGGICADIRALSERWILLNAILYLYILFLASLDLRWRIYAIQIALRLIYLVCFHWGLKPHIKQNTI